MEILGGSDMLLLELLTSGEHTEIIVLEQQEDGCLRKRSDNLFQRGDDLACYSRLILFGQV